MGLITLDDVKAGTPDPFFAAQRLLERVRVNVNESSACRVHQHRTACFFILRKNCIDGFPLWKFGSSVYHRSMLLIDFASFHDRRLPHWRSNRQGPPVVYLIVKVPQC